MDKPLNIFISSAIVEFRGERGALKIALERWQFVRAWVFENETASSRRQSARRECALGKRCGMSNPFVL